MSTQRHDNSTSGTPMEAGVRRGRFASMVVLVLALACGMAGAQTFDLSQDQEHIRITGEVVGDLAGKWVSSGDINGDGVDDIIIGALNADAGALVDAGKVYVVYGDTSYGPSPVPLSIDLATGADVTIRGERAGDKLGTSVTSGDIDGDGIDDIVIGASSASPETRSQAGAVYVIYGKRPDAQGAGGLDAVIDLSLVDTDVEIQGGLIQDEVGYSVLAEDVNGDGIDDLLIGATGVDESASNAGAVYVIYGKRPDAQGDGGLDAVIDLSLVDADITFYAEIDNYESGSALAIGNLDGDDYADIIIGAQAARPNGLSNAGEIYIVYGSQELYDADPDTAIGLLLADVTLQGQVESETLGLAIAVGDLNRDGFDDLIFGGPGATPDGRLSAGITYVLLGTDDPRPTGVVDLSAMDLSIWGAEQYTGSGSAVMVANFDGDGFDELITSIPGFSPTPERAYAGQILGFYGDPVYPTSATDIIDMADYPDANYLDPILTVIGDEFLDYAGQYIGRGDLNDDGVEDLIIGAVQPNVGPGEVYVLFGTYPTLDVSVTSGSASYNQPVPVSVSIDDNTGMKIVEADLHISYNNLLLAFSGAQTAGTLIADWDVTHTIVTGATRDTLKIRITRPPMEPALNSTDTGALIHISFMTTNLRRALTDTLGFELLSFNGGRSDWNVLTGGQITLTGVDGALEASTVSETGDTVRVRVVDADLNADSTAVDTVWVRLNNSRTGEEGLVPLAEQAVNSEIFFGEVLTSISGAFSSQGGDEWELTYTDSLSLAGPEVALIDTNWVLLLGDADGNGSRQAYDAARILAHTLGQIQLTDTLALAANVDLAAPGGAITSYDAALVIQRRLGLIERFPVQTDSSANHPQPETQQAPKPLSEERLLALIPEGDQWVVWMEDREGILAGDLLIEGMEGTIEMASELGHFQAAYRNAEDGLRVAFAGAYAARSSGELFRITPTGLASAVRGLRGSFNGGQIVVRAEAGDIPALPQQLALHPNAPNPFNAQTLIRFDLPTDQEVRLEIFNALGQMVRTLVDGRVEAGAHQIPWDSRNDRGASLASGPYLYRLTAGSRVQTQRMLLLK